MAAIPNFCNTPFNYAKRIIGLSELPSNANPSIGGFENQAFIIAGTGTAQFKIECGMYLPGSAGRKSSLTIASGGGALTVASNGLDITVTLASGGSTAAAVVAAINSQFPAPTPPIGPTAPVWAASLTSGAGAGGGSVATLSKTYFTSNQVNP